MIQFYIANQEIILPSDFAFSWNEQNPFVNDKGEFSLDITVTILEPVNAKAFKFIHRINNKNGLITANAKLIDNGKTYYGTINVIENSDQAVTFQFLSGNSEFKFLTDNSNQIWELDFGSLEAAIDVNTALTSIANIGYSNTNHFVCAPVLCGTTILNDFRLSVFRPGSYSYKNTSYNISEQIPLQNDFYDLDRAVAAVPTNLRSEDFVLLFYEDKNTLKGYQYKHSNLDDAHWKDTTRKWSTDGNWEEFYPKFIMQPYLLHYINMIPGLFGYTMKINVLNDDDRAKIMYLISTANSLVYSDALPDVTVTTFISEIEKLFNVKFEVDSSDKSISIIRLNDSIKEKEIIPIIPINGYLKQYNNEVMNDRFDFTKVKYDLDDTDYFVYQRISDENLKQLKVMEFDNFTLLENYISTTPGLYNLKVLYRDNTTQYEYFVWPEELAADTFKTTFYWKRIICGNKVYYLARVNKFRSWGDSDDKVQTLSIIPASMKSIYKYITYVASSNGVSLIPHHYQVPVASTSLWDPSVSGFQELIEGTIESVSRNSKIVVALYTGKINLSWSVDYPIYIDYPHTHIDDYPEYIVADAYMTYFRSKINKTMSLTANNGVVIDNKYANVIDDITSIYQFSIVEFNQLSIKNLFEYEGRRYLPISFECEKKNNKKSIVTAKMFRLLSS